MANVDIGPLIEAIGRLLIGSVSFEPNGSFLFAEMLERKMACAVYQKVDGRIAEEPCSREVQATIRLVRQLETPKKRWSTLAYRIREPKFFVDFGFPDNYPAGETPEVRRVRLVKQWSQEYGRVPDEEEDEAGSLSLTALTVPR